MPFKTLKGFFDTKHCYKGWKISRPAACTTSFAYVLNLSALDKGLLLHNAKRRGHKRDLSSEDEI